MFEPHGDGYIVFGKQGGALFSVEERDAYVAAHRKAKPGWKALPIVMASILGVAMVEFVALNAMLRWWPALRSSSDVVVSVVAAIALTLPVALMAGLAYPSIRLILRVRREADRRTSVAPPRETPSWTRKLPNWAAFLGVIGFTLALAAGRVAPTWPWILAGCVVAGLVAYVVSRPKTPPRL
jgi:hypothetical protein